MAELKDISEDIWEAQVKKYDVQEISTEVSERAKECFSKDYIAAKRKAEIRQSASRIASTKIVLTS